MMTSLKVDALDKDPQGHCSGDIRTVSQSVELNGSGFLTVHVGIEYDGGAHPEDESDYFNFNVATGANVGPNDIFAAGSEAQVKALIEKGINAQVGKDGFTAQDAKDQIDEFETHWGDDVKLDAIAMGVTQKGLVIDMGNNYPHVVLALAPLVTVAWSDVKPLLKAGSPLASIAQ
jgi:hypothetical protein